jgi:uncharacterized protein (DUF1501 family)
MALEYSANNGAGGNNPRSLAATAGKTLADPKGPRLAVMEIGGWDTHVGQEGRLTRALTELDGAVASLAQTLAPVWGETAILVFTEFGRTAAPNGSQGTDHGTATAAFLIGGKVAGGQVLTRWPGLATSNLYQGRDLAPTADLRGLFKGVLAGHLGLPQDALNRIVFPASAEISTLTGLFRA